MCTHTYYIELLMQMAESMEVADGHDRRVKLYVGNRRQGVIAVSTLGMSRRTKAFGTMIHEDATLGLVSFGA